MDLRDLSYDTRKDIIKKLLYKVEINKDFVDKELKHRKVYKYNGKYCLNFYNGYEYKIVSIDNYNADISSESILDNVELTKYYQQILAEELSKLETSTEAI